MPENLPLQSNSIKEPSRELQLWLHTSLFSLGLFVVMSIYAFFEHGYYDINAFDQALSHSAFILIGLSLALSSICYFWDFADSKIIYRKYLGLSGYFLLVFHLCVLLLFLTDQYPFPQYYLSEEHVIPFFFLALPAVSIYTLMAVISNRYAMQRLGGHTWRMVLRLGFVAYSFSIAYFAYVSYEEWVQWFREGEAFVPGSLLMVYLGVLVIFLRIAMEISKRFTPRVTPVNSSANQPYTG